MGFICPYTYITEFDQILGNVGIVLWYSWDEASKKS